MTDILKKNLIETEENKCEFPYLPLDEFLNALKKDGFSIGIDTYLNLNKILKNIDVKNHYNELKTILCPILARNKEEQARFYSIYENYFPDFFIQSEKPKRSLIKEKRKEVDEFSNLTKREITRTTAITLTIIFALISITSLLVMDTNKDPSPIPDSLGDTQIENGRKGRKTISDIKTHGSNKGGFTLRNAFVLTFLSLAFLSLLFLLRIVLFQLYKFHQMQIATRRQKNKSPPFVWPLFINNIDISPNNELNNIAYQMRFKEEGITRKLDINKSIKATIKNWGHTNLKYSHQEKSIEYLMFIDCSSDQNHQSMLFEYFHKIFLKNNVYIDRFFYHKDPRICWNEQYPEGIHLTNIQGKYAGNSLLIFGDCKEFIDPITGMTTRWANIFEHCVIPTFITSDIDKKNRSSFNSLSWWCY